MHQVRRVALEDTALAQRAEHQAGVTLYQVAYTAVYQLGAAARRAFGEIKGLKQQGAIATRCSVHRCAKPGCSAADHDDIPSRWLACLLHKCIAASCMALRYCLHGC